MLIATVNDGALNTEDREFDTINDAIAFVCLQSDTYASYVRSRFLAPASLYEASSWALKLSEAQGHGISPTPMLDIEAQARGVSTAQLASKVVAKAQQLAVLEATIAGINGRHNDAIKALATVGEVIAYDWRSGYPDVAV